MLNIFIGYDPRQAIAYNVLQFSILRRTSRPVAICPLVLGTLPIDRQGLTPFTYSRFLVSWLCDYQGWALFLDLDILCVADIAEIFEHGFGDEQRHAVWTVDTDPAYERAAVMLFACGHPDNKVLTPDAVNERGDLHLIGWTKNRGRLSPRWNHLVGYDAPCSDPALIHYTMGVPAHKETQDCEHADLWRQEQRAMNSTQDWQTLMGKSAHVVDGKPRYKVA